MPAKKKTSEVVEEASVEEVPTSEVVEAEPSSAEPVESDAEISEELPETLPEEKKSRKRGKKNEPVTPVENITPPKPVPTSARAISKNVRVTPRKARLVIDLVRGKDVEEAIAILHNVNKAATPMVIKTIKSAAANATNNFGMDEHSLYISEIYASDGLKMKRYLPRAKGRASHLTKRTCHITCVVRMR